MNAPKMEGACVLHAPDSPKLRLPHSYQRCSPSAKKIERLPAGHVHFATDRCVDCGCLLRWVPKPSTIERRILNAYRPARLGMCEGLSKWERGFVRDISQRQKLSPRQQRILAELCAKYLKEKTP